MIDETTDVNGELSSTSIDDNNAVREQSSTSTLSLGDTHIWRDNADNV
jgi:hypothetical protein